MKFTNKQIDYVKHCGEHFELLMGGRGHSKTKQIIEQLQRENQQLKEKYLEYKKDFYEANDMLFEFQTKNKQLKERVEQLELILEEIRDYINNNRVIVSDEMYFKYTMVGKDLLQIIDKSMEEK